MRRLTLLFFMVLLIPFVVLGCAGTRTTRRESVVTETTAAGERTQENENAIAQTPTNTVGQDNSRVVEKTTEIKEERTTDEQRGILGTTFHVIGQIIALPFRVVAGLIGIIF